MHFLLLNNFVLEVVTSAIRSKERRGGGREEERKGQERKKMGRRRNKGKLPRLEETKLSQLAGSMMLYIKVILDKVLIAQLCPTLCDPVERSPPDSSVHRFFQTRILEQVAIPFSRASF